MDKQIESNFLIQQFEKYYSDYELLAKEVKVFNTRYDSLIVDREKIQHSLDEINQVTADAGQLVVQRKTEKKSDEVSQLKAKLDQVNTEIAASIIESEKLWARSARVDAHYHSTYKILRDTHDYLDRKGKEYTK